MKRFKLKRTKGISYKNYVKELDAVEEEIKSSAACCLTHLISMFLSLIKSQCSGFSTER